MLSNGLHPVTVAALQAVVGEAALDVVAFETVPCLKELRAISRLMRTEFPGTPAWVSCSCRDAGHIAHGESLAGVAPQSSILKGFYPVIAWPRGRGNEPTQNLQRLSILTVSQGFAMSQLGVCAGF